MRIYQSILLSFFCLNVTGQIKKSSAAQENSQVNSINTNFIVPITRFNIFHEQNEENGSGRMEIFNSVGAGISINRGSLRETHFFNNQGEITESHQEFTNQIGLQLGILFSADSRTDKIKTSFAPTAAVHILDFHIGWGYELGEKEADETGHFFTLSYGIPIQKITSKGSWILNDKSKQLTPLLVNQ